MLSARLVKLIEEHAEQLTAGLVNDLQTNPRTEAYHKLSHHELHRRAYDVYRHLGEWLGHKADDRIEANYRGLGEERHAEDIPLHEVVYALIVIKYHLRDYVRAAGLMNSTVELYQQLELDRLVGQFFDKATYYAVKGYESAAAMDQEMAVVAHER
jgi:hypothetical protein